ncbi:mannose binding [Mactra antiquata]
MIQPLIFTVLFMFGTSFHGCEGCRNSWISFEGMCYSFNNTRMNWFHASHACKASDAWLVDVQNKAESDFLKSTINRLHAHENPQQVGYWTGGNDLDFEGQWVWEYPAQTSMTFTDWYPGEPNNIWYDKRAEDCVVLWGHANYGYQWNDQPCDIEDYFVCKMKDPSTEVIG